MAMKKKTVAKFEDFRVVPNDKPGMRPSGASKKDLHDVAKKLNKLGESRQYDRIKKDGAEYIRVSDKKSKQTLSEFRIDATAKRVPVRKLRVKLSAGTISAKKIFEAI